MSNFISQGDAAWESAHKEAVRLRELALKHNVTITMEIHDSMTVTGEAADVDRFVAEYKRWRETVNSEKKR